MNRKARRLLGLSGKPIRYTDRRKIGRNTLVTVDGGEVMKFKRTGAYRMPRAVE